MVCLVEDEEIYLFNRDERMHQTLTEYFGRAYNDHVFCEDFPPSFLGPKITPHFSTEALDLLIEIALEYGELLEHEGHAVNLEDNEF